MNAAFSMSRGDVGIAERDHLAFDAHAAMARKFSELRRLARRGISAS
jgi:hypothetical protein